MLSEAWGGLLPRNMEATEGQQVMQAQNAEIKYVNRLLGDIEPLEKLNMLTAYSATY